MPPEDQPTDEQSVDPVNAAQREFEAKRISRRSALRKLGLTFGQVSAGFLLSEPFVHAVAVRLEEHESNRQLTASLLDAIEHSAETLVKAEANLNCPPDPPPGVEAQRSSSSGTTGGGGTRSSSSSATGGGGARSQQQGNRQTPVLRDPAVVPVRAQNRVVVQQVRDQAVLS